MRNIPIDWLLEGEPWIAYRTRVDLLGENELDPAVSHDRQAMLESPPVKGLLAELASWPCNVIASHKSAGQPFHKLTFLADLGLKSTDPGMEKIVERIFMHRSEDGPFLLPTNVPVHFGGSGKEEWAWALCDAPIIVYALARFGLAREPAVEKAATYLAGLIRGNGWPCAVSKELGNFRGPGRKDDPCPYANLVMLKALAEFTGHREAAACRTGGETLLALWQASRERHPYMFFMGSDFRKLKVPFVWYDLLHVLEVLSRLPWLRQDERLHQMLESLKSRSDGQGRFTVESAWMAWKDWEFGQKKAPSRWLTLLAWRIIQRIESGTS